MSMEAESVARQSGQSEEPDWVLTYVLSASVLRSYDPLSRTLDFLVDVMNIADHKTALGTVIAELYTNALDHGILKLESSVKSSPEGFLIYYQQKEERLKNLEQGSITFSFTLFNTTNGGKIVISTEDSGEGFDYKAKLNKDYAQKDYAGRGLRLLKSFCEDVCFNESGNKITVTFVWTNEAGTSTTDA